MDQKFWNNVLQEKSPRRKALEKMIKENREMTIKDRLISIATIIAIVAMFLFLWLAIPDYAYPGEYDFTGSSTLNTVLAPVEMPYTPTFEPTPFDSSVFDRIEKREADRELFKLQQEVERANSWDRQLTIKE